MFFWGAETPSFLVCTAYMAQVAKECIWRTDPYPRHPARSPTFPSRQHIFDKQCLKMTNLDQIITTKTAKLGPDNITPQHAYIYIYIYMAVGSFAAANFTIFGIFPQLYSKKWPKRDVANLPHLSIYVFDKNRPKRPETAIPSFFLKKRHWDCSPRPFSWFIWVSKSYLAQKNL